MAYCYCDFRTGLSTSALEVMRSLLAQLTEHLCAVMTNPEWLLDELLNAAGSRVALYSTKRVSRYISKVAILCPRIPHIVVDGLDECKDVENLLDGLLMCGCYVKTFVTTRPLRNITQMLSNFQCISMVKVANELSADILLHVTRELDSRSRLRSFNDRVRREIRSKICAKADGM